MKWLLHTALTLAVATMLFGVALADIPGVGPNEAAVPPQNRTAPPSPKAGFTSTETNSRIDDYINQPDQIYLNENSGTVKVLRVNERNLIQDYVVEVIPLANPNALDSGREVRAVFRTLTAQEGGRAEIIRDKVGKKAFMYVICPKFQLPWIREAVKALDVPWVKENQDGFMSVYYRAKNRAIAEVDTLATIPIADGTSVFDTFNNAVMRRQDPYRAWIYLRWAEAVDIAAPQVILEGTIYEINLNDDAKLGLDYVAWKNGPGRNLFQSVSGSTNTNQDFTNVASLWDPTSQRFVPAKLTNTSQDLNTATSQKYTAVNFLMTAAYIDFLSTRGKARVVARPKIICRSNQVATFSTMDEITAFNVVPDVTTRTPIGLAPVTDSKGNIISYGSGAIGVDNRTLNHSLVGTTPSTTTGISLTVLPNIGLESTEVAVTLSYRSIAGVAPQGTPIINTRAIQTRVRIRDGQPLLITGLNRFERIDRFAGAPFLSAIPILGYLFGGEEHGSRKTELVVVLTPRIFQTPEGCSPTPEDVNTMDLVLDKKPNDIPYTPYGFDQWLLDPNVERR